LATSDQPGAAVSGKYFFHQKLRDPDPNARLSASFEIPSNCVIGERLEAGPPTAMARHPSYKNDE
jgi:hypothetical protein